MKKKKFVFCSIDGKWSGYLHSAFSDLMKDDRVIWLNDRYKELRFPLLKWLRKIHLSSKINNIIRLPGRRIWSYALDTVQWDDDTDYYVIFLDNILPIDPEYLKSLKKKHSIKYVLFLINSWIPPHDERAQKSIDAIPFDYIFSYNPDDAKKLGFIFTDNIYSMRSDVAVQAMQYDLYYIGGNNGRLQDALAVYAGAKAAGVKQLFRISGVNKEDMVYQNEIIYNQFINYGESVNELLGANCILELMRRHETGMCASARYYEAICYNKKLLTNNKNIVNLPFYQLEYMHVFETPDDIDWEWVKEQIPIDYHYDGRFSPSRLIDRIIDLEKERTIES